MTAAGAALFLIIIIGTVAIALVVDAVALVALAQYCRLEILADVGHSAAVNTSAAGARGANTRHKMWGKMPN